MLPLILKVFYSVMVAIVLSLMVFYARGLASGRRTSLIAKVPFYGWIGSLVVAAIGFHVLTAWQVPWVGWELKRSRIKPDQEVVVNVKGHQFSLPGDGIRIKQGEMVRFRVRSEDLTYGFGVFRENGLMEFQMQVIPGHDNDIIWAFSKPGLYSVRSTEYAGPQTWKMHAKNVIEVASDLRVARK
jgi:cytochrome c oxidase subunit 2